jgi:hypothetical protein
MQRMTAVLVITGAVAGLACTSGCEEESSGPPPQPQQPLSGLSENPTSLYGKSAKMGKDAAHQIGQADAAALGTAQELTGEAAPVNIAGLSWSVPTEWRRIEPPRNMWAAEFRVPGAAGEGIVGFAHYGAEQGGNVQQNIARWQGLMPQAVPEISKRTVVGLPVTLMTMEGTYLDGMMSGNPTQRPDYAFRGAIAEGPKGTVFIRLHGPISTVEGADLAWERMVGGMRKE